MTEARRGDSSRPPIPDIARAATEPDIDFREGTFLTQQVVEAMRVTGAPRLLYASGSGVYGDLGELEATEDHGPLIPVSTYGASKLAGEALIASYCAMFGLTRSRVSVSATWWVLGRRTASGFDFVRRLLDDPSRLRILGDGSQSKTYIHVIDVVNAVLLRARRELPEAVRGVQRRHRRLHHGDRDRQSWPWKWWVLRPEACDSSIPAATAAGRAMFRWFA